MRKKLNRPGWTRSRSVQNFMAGWLASSLAVPLFVMADPLAPLADAATAPATAENAAPSAAPAVTPSPSPSPEASESPAPELSFEEEKEEFLNHLGETEFSCSREIEAARRDAKSHASLFNADEMRDILKALDEEEVKLVNEKVTGAESLDDLSDAIDELSSLADDRCELIRKEKYGSDKRHHSSKSRSRSSSKEDSSSSKKKRARDLEKEMLTIASIFHKAAQKQVVLAKAEGEDGFALAHDTIEKAIDVKCLDSRAKDRLKGYERDLKIMKCQAAAEMGSIGGIEVQFCSAELMMELLPQVQSDCSTQTGGSMEQCVATLTALQRVKSFPAKMQEVDKQRMQQQQQMQQILQSAMGAGQQSGTPGGLPMTNGSSGSNFLWSMGNYGSTSPNPSAPLPGVNPLPTM